MYDMKVMSMIDFDRVKSQTIVPLFIKLGSWGSDVY